MPIAGSDAPEFDPAPIRTLVEAASKLSTGRFAQYTGDFPDGVGLTPERLAIRFEFDDGSPHRTLKIGAPAGNGLVFATTEPEAKGSIIFLPEASFARFLKAPRHQGDLPDNVFAP